jgi:predicted enzyme related to lactoylglutathione lyase
MFAGGARYFEIPASNLDRAVAFYSTLFSIEFERARIDNLDMALFPAVDGQPVISGALVVGESYVPSHDGTRVYFACTDIDAALMTVARLGGKVLYPKTSIGDLGFVAEFEDSEGNRIALHCPPAVPPAS